MCETKNNIENEEYDVDCGGIKPIDLTHESDSKEE